MYKYIYFDLDDTLVRDNPITSKSEILKSGLDTFNRVSKEYPNVSKILFSNRNRRDIKYPNVYRFTNVIGREDMKEYIKENIRDVKINNLISFTNLYIFLKGYILFKNNSTPKLLYLFLKHIIKKENILVFDDDMRVSGEY